MKMLNFDPFHTSLGDRKECRRHDTNECPCCGLSQGHDKFKEEPGAGLRAVGLGPGDGHTER